MRVWNLFLTNDGEVLVTRDRLIRKSFAEAVW